MNFRQVRKKIKSINNVKKITRAMQLVSAVKMKKAQAAVSDGRPYRENLEKIIRKISGKVDPQSSELLKTKDSTSATKKGLIIFVSSNKGLCGAFHLNINRFLMRNVDFKNNDFITVGKKGALFVGKMGGHIIADHSVHNPLVEVSAIFNQAVGNFLMDKYDTVTIVYNRFISNLRSEQVKDTLLPVQMTPEMKRVEGTSEVAGEYTIEPSPKAIIDSLLKSYVEEKIRGAIMSSEAVEHSSRMIAMKNATDNANEVIYDLTLLGNKLRQTKITMELLDMVTAKESVETG